VKNKVRPLAEAAELVTDGMTVMIGGFMGCGNPHRIIDALVERGTSDLVVICNDASIPGYGLAKLVEGKRLRKLVASHVGLNPEVAVQMGTGELDVELVPQGSLIEKIRAGGAGLGGVLTPTGVGTLVEEGKQVLEVQGRRYLLEEPLRADVALINGTEVDTVGNVWYRGTTRNFNVLMATSADVVIAEADRIVDVGQIAPENVVTPSVLVDVIVDGGRP
jgi:acetate CoA/acetoacetate CoA-transferase alpha subunit